MKIHIGDDEMHEILCFAKISQKLIKLDDFVKNVAKVKNLR